MIQIVRPPQAYTPCRHYVLLEKNVNEVSFKLSAIASDMPGPIYQFGDFQLDSGRFELLRNGRAERVERKPMELLILLVSRQGQLVSRAEIAQRLWSSEVFVDTEHGINTAIRKLRYLLRDDSEEPKFIQTVTGMGYRFVAPTISIGGPATDLSKAPADELDRKSVV